jgi:hypothetical protein
MSEVVGGSRSIIKTDVTPAGVKPDSLMPEYSSQVADGNTKEPSGLKIRYLLRIVCSKGAYRGGDQ